MADRGADGIFETTLTTLRECHDRMDFPPRTRTEAEARFRLIQACVTYAERFGGILSDESPDA